MRVPGPACPPPLAATHSPKRSQDSSTEPGPHGTQFENRCSTGSEVCREVIAGRDRRTRQEGRVLGQLGSGHGMALPDPSQSGLLAWPLAGLWLVGPSAGWSVADWTSSLLTDRLAG